MRLLIKNKLNPMQLITLAVILVALVFMLKSNSYSQSYSAIFSAFFLFIFLFLLDGKCAYAMVSSIEFLLLLYFLFFVFIMDASYYGIKTAFGGVGNYFLFYFGFTLFLFFKHKNQPKTWNWIVALTLVLYVFHAARLLLLYLENPGIARFIISGKADLSISERYGNPYGIAQGLCFISIALLDIFLSVRKRFFVVVVMLALIVLFSVVVILTQSAITLLVLVVGYVFCFVNRLSKNKKNSALIIVLLIILVVFLFRGAIGTAIMRNADLSSITGIRMYELGEFFANGTRSNDISARSGLFWQSFYTFLEHPIVGNLYTVGAMSGNHAEIVDIFSDFGLMGGVPLLLIFVLFFRRVLKIVGGQRYLLWLPALLYSFLNPFAGVQSYLAMLFVVPSLYVFAMLRDGAASEYTSCLMNE